MVESTRCQHARAIGKDGVECSIHFGGTIAFQQYQLVIGFQGTGPGNASGTRRRVAT